MRKYNEEIEMYNFSKMERMALKRYGFRVKAYTDMNAIRPDENLDHTHSIYVDQWDWEKIISKEERNEEYLKRVVKDIYQVFKDTEKKINSKHPFW